MAKRYSGDVEIRLSWDPRARAYRDTVRDPHKRWRGTVSARYAYRLLGRDLDGSAAYDDAARRLIQAAETDVGPLMVERSRGRIRIRRIFQAPCPVGGVPQGRPFRLTRSG